MGTPGLDAWTKASCENPLEGRFLLFVRIASLALQVSLDLSEHARDAVFLCLGFPPNSLVYFHYYPIRFSPLFHVVSRTLLLEILILPQQKNTCAHNKTHKAHANGIKKAKRTKYVSTRGMDPKFLRNQKFAKKYNGSKRVHDE